MSRLHARAPECARGSRPAVGCFGEPARGLHWDWCRWSPRHLWDLSAGLWGVCYAMALDVLVDGFPGGPERVRMAGWGLSTAWRYNGEAVKWLALQAAPPPHLAADSDECRAIAAGVL